MKNLPPSTTARVFCIANQKGGVGTVSYTHLTLPTIYSV